MSKQYPSTKKKLPFKRTEMSREAYEARLRKIHDWWNYGINPITGWPSNGGGKPSKGKYGNDKYLPANR